MTKEEMKGAVEAILFTAGDAFPVEDLAQVFSVTCLEMESMLRELTEEMAPERGIEFYLHGGNVQLRTRGEYAPYIQKALLPTQRKSLSRSVMETLAVIAYKQPITRAEIEALRGVSADYSVQILVQRGLVVPAGRKDAVGRPMLYRTTEEFLRHFNLKGLEGLPNLPALEEEDFLSWEDEGSQREKSGLEMVES